MALTVLSPSSVVADSTLSVDVTSLPLTVQADSSVSYVAVQIYGNPDFVLTAGLHNTFSGNLPIDRRIETPSETRIVARGAGGSFVSSLRFFIVYYNDQNLVTFISPPSGFRCYKRQNSCLLEWITPPYVGVLGVRVQISTDYTGVTTPYAQVGPLVNNVTRSAEVLVSEVDSEVQKTPDDQQDGDYLLTYDVTKRYQTYTYGSLEIASSYVGADIFYAVASVVLQDPVSNQVYESQQVGPITCGFVNLKAVNPTDFLALQRKEDIAQRMISQIIRVYPDLDLTPRSEIRDTIIDPISVEGSNMSVRQWFGLCCQSVSALYQIDDSDGSGFSDPVAESPLKQQLANAFGLNSADMQAYIDHAFDVMGEDAGVTRGGATTSTGQVTFFTYVRPTTLISISPGAVVSTLADSSTASVSFVTTGLAQIDPKSADSMYDPTKGWWSVTVPVQCSVAGSVGTVGAGAIRQVVSGVPQGISCVNSLGTTPAYDIELNSRFAERIKNRKLVGVDTGTRYGYWSQAIQTPGITQANVVAAGDSEMLRDWLPADVSDVTNKVKRPGKHIYGCVDIYTRGTSYDEQVDQVSYTYDDTGFIPLTLASTGNSLVKFSANVTQPLYTVLQILVTIPSSADVRYLGVKLAKISNQGNTAWIYLDPNEEIYRLDPSGVSYPDTYSPSPGITANKSNAYYLSTLSNSKPSYTLHGRYHSDLNYVPSEQPLLSVNSVSGVQTGTIESKFTSIIHTQDFLLGGGSNKAGDAVKVDSNQTTPVRKTLTFMGGVPYALIDANVSMFIYASGDDASTKFLNQYIQSMKALNLSIPTAVANLGLQVATDGSITALDGTIFPPLGFTVLDANSYDPVKNISDHVYYYGIDYTIGVAGSYQQYYMKLTDNSAVLNQVVPLNSFPAVLVTYLQYTLTEKYTLRVDTITVSGIQPEPLTYQGFVRNTWLPNSYGDTTLTADVTLATSPETAQAINLPKEKRYLKVQVYLSDGTYLMMKEGRDFNLSVDGVSGLTYLTAIVGGALYNLSRITPTSVKVTYFTTEVFTVNTLVPTWVQQLAVTLDSSKHAGADVLVKAMVASPVDITMTVTVNPSATIDTVDSRVRSTLGTVLNNTGASLKQSELIRQVKALNGVNNVQIPLTKCAKQNGSYDIGVVLPTTTPWVASTGNSDVDMGINNPLSPSNTVRISSDHQDVFVAHSINNSILPNNTIDSGGMPNAYVGLLYEGEQYSRAMSQVDFNQRLDMSFYITATGYIWIRIPKYQMTANERAYILTYQVWNEEGAKDIVTSSTEYLSPGTITVNYVVGS